MQILGRISRVVIFAALLIGQFSRAESHLPIVSGHSAKQTSEKFLREVSPAQAGLQADTLVQQGRLESALNESAWTCESGEPILVSDLALKRLLTDENKKNDYFKTIPSEDDLVTMLQSLMDYKSGPELVQAFQELERLYGFAKHRKILLSIQLKSCLTGELPFPELCSYFADQILKIARPEEMGEKLKANLAKAEKLAGEKNPPVQLSQREKALLSLGLSTKPVEREVFGRIFLGLTGAEREEIRKRASSALGIEVSQCELLNLKASLFNKPQFALSLLQHPGLATAAVNQFHSEENAPQLLSLLSKDSALEDHLLPSFIIPDSRQRGSRDVVKFREKLSEPSRLWLERVEKHIDVKDGTLKNIEFNKAPEVEFKSRISPVLLESDLTAITKNLSQAVWTCKDGKLFDPRAYSLEHLKNNPDLQKTFVNLSEGEAEQRLGHLIEKFKSLQLSDGEVVRELDEIVHSLPGTRAAQAAESLLPAMVRKGSLRYLVEFVYKGDPTTQVQKEYFYNELIKLRISGEPDLVELYKRLVLKLSSREPEGFSAYQQLEKGRESVLKFLEVDFSRPNFFKFSPESIPEKCMEMPLDLQDLYYPLMLALGDSKVSALGVSGLGRLLESNNEDMRNKSADLLSRLGPDAKWAASYLVKVAQEDRNGETRYFASMALTHIPKPPPEVRQALVNALEDEELDMLHYKYNIVNAFHRADDFPELVPALLKLLKRNMDVIEMRNIILSVLIEKVPDNQLVREAVKKYGPP